MLSSDDASSAIPPTFAIVALPRMARAWREKASRSGVDSAREINPSRCSTCSLASRIKKSRRPAFMV
jgi:hypothetical protein